jgi:tetratricopeptide (TPR) repeat protein
VVDDRNATANAGFTGARLGLLNDEPTAEDEFDRERFATTLADIVVSSATPLVVACYGTWGSGKTSLMRQVQRLLEGGPDSKERRAGTVWFDPWRSSGDEQPAVALLHAMRKDLGLDDDNEVRGALVSIAQAVANEVQVPYVGLTIGKLRKAVRERAEQDFRRHSEQARLDSYFEKVIDTARKRLNGLPLVVFIDDLDRCRPSIAVGLMEALKLHFNLPGCAYILGVDRQPLEAAIAVEYQGLSIARESYLDKIVQLPFTIPVLGRQSVQNYLERNFPNGLQSALRMMATAAPDNPRQLKRTINALLLHNRLASTAYFGSQPYREEIMCLVVIMQNAAPDLYWRLRTSPADWIYVLNLMDTERSTPEPSAPTWLQSMLDGSDARHGLAAVLESVRIEYAKTIDMIPYMTLSDPLMASRDGSFGLDPIMNSTADSSHVVASQGVATPTQGSRESTYVRDRLESGVTFGERQVANILGDETALLPNKIRALIDLASSYESVGRIDDAINTAREGVNLAVRENSDFQSRSEALTLLGSLLGASGNTTESTTIAQQLVDESTSTLGPEYSETLRARNTLANSLGESGQVDAAIAEFRRLLDDQTRVYGPDHPESLTARNNLAGWLGESGQINAAIAEFRLLLSDRIRVLGPDHPDTLTTRNNLASLLGESGQVEAAIAEFRLLLNDQIRVFGPDNPDTLITRNNLASWLGKSGQVGLAVAEFGQLLSDRIRVLGTDDVHTLAARHNLASMLGESGQVDAAVAEFRRLLIDQTRVLGPDSPGTLMSRNNLASWLGESGQVETAIAELRSLVDDQLRVLGPDHPDSLRSRNNLARWLGVSGQVEGAVAELQQLSNDYTRLLGPDHPESLATRNNLAHWLGESGQVDTAITELRLLLNDRTRVLGHDHPDTLATRNSLARWLGESGQVDTAIAELRRLLGDRTRVIGSDHPGTLMTRFNLATWLGQSGQVESAITDLRQLLNDQTRIIGSSHPDTLRTRNNLAHWLAESGQLDAAVVELRKLLNDQIRVIGYNHPDTRKTRKDLALWTEK